MLTRGKRTPHLRTRRLLAWGVVMLVALTMAGTRLRAQLPLQPAGSPFEMVGFIQTATLNNPNDVFSGGTMTLNNHVVTVPRNTILQMPATALTWAELFKLAPPPYGPTQTGLALNDVPKPPVTYDVFVQGNRIGDTYIAGLIFISQQSTNTHVGFINAIDYTNGELLVGGTPGVATTGTRVRINDPIGRFGRAMSSDVRFTIDEGNPTVRTETAFPMCLPRTNPAAQDDPACPQKNRPKTGNAFQMVFTMPPQAAFAANRALADSTKMAPFEIGDYITYSGTLVKDATGGYIQAWQIIGNVGIFTAPGDLPSYVAIDVIVMGAGPNNNVVLAQEGAKRMRVEGFTTDPSNPIDIFAVDVDSCSGLETPRYWATQSVEQIAPLGRFRFRPAAPLFNLAGFPFLPPIREVLIQSEGGQLDLPNGLTSGQYQAPNFQFVFTENLGIGTPPVPENLEDFAFLSQGSGPWDGGGPFKTPHPLGITRQLSPWPGPITPFQIPCAAANVAPPIANAGANQTVSSRARVTLSSAGSSDPGGRPLTFAWQQISGVAVALTGANTATASFVAPVVPVGGAPTPLQFMLTVDNGTFSSTQSTTVSVNPALAPLANAGLPQTVSAGSVVTLSGTGSDPNVPPLGALTLNWSQATGSIPVVALTPTSAQGVSPATARFTAPGIPAGQTSLTLTFVLTVGNGAPVLGSATTATTTSTTTVTVVPPQPPVVTAGAAQTVASGAAVTLTGTAVDPNNPPQTDTNVWSQVLTAGQPTVTLTQGGTAAAPTATFTAPVIPSTSTALTLTFRLSSTNTGGTSTATTTVTISPAKPLIVGAGAAQTVTSGAPVTLGGTVSDPNVPTLGAITSTWSTTTVGITLTQGGTPTAPTATFVAPTIAAGGTPQTITFTLTASNGAGPTSATTTVTVNPPPANGLPPTVTAGANQTVNSNAPVTLSGTAVDPNTPAIGTLSSSWAQVVNAGDPVVTVTNTGTVGARTATLTAPVIASTAAARTLTFVLTSTNGAGSSTATTLVTVTPAKALTANAGAARTVNSGAPVTLTGSVTDLNVPTVGAFTSVWSTTTAGITLTQGGTAAAPTVSFAAPIIAANGAAQVIPFTLTVTSAAGISTSPVNVTVNPAQPLTVSAGAAQTVGAGSLVTLSGTVADPNVPTLGAITSAWSTTTAGITLTQGGTATARTATFTAPATAQSITFTLTATNAAGTFSAPTTVTVTVGPAVDVTVSANTAASGPSATLTTPAFSTTTAGDLLVAFVGSDGPPQGNTQTLTVSGGGLTWSRVQRAATQAGDSEIWTARAPATGVLTNITVTSTETSTLFHQMLTVVAFKSVSAIGASAAANAAAGPAAVSLVAQAAGSLVYAVGNDWDSAVANLTVSAGQSLVGTPFLPNTGDTIWVERTNALTSAVGATVTLNASVPATDRWNLAIVELRP